MRRHILYGALLTAVVGLSACNSDDDESLDPNIYDTTPTSAAITKFNLAANTKVLTGLDSVFFSINLREGLIFNADSLPVGTRINGLTVEMSTNQVSKAEITFSRGEGLADTTINYLENPNDTIDFSHGPAVVKITAADGTTEATYQVSVNVHKMSPDSLNWYGAAMGPLPTTFAWVDEQKTVRRGTTLACLTRNKEQYCMGLSDEAAINRWHTTPVTFTFQPRVETFAATADAYYILDKVGRLYTSTDALEWRPTDERIWSWIYGGYEDTLLGNGKDGDIYVQLTYPASASQSLAESMPVSGTSMPILMEVSWSSHPQVFMVGGRKADGSLSRDTWAYDGSRWACISTTGLSEPLEGVAIVPYYYFVTNTQSWKATQYNVVMALGGRKADGTLNTSVYVSFNNGMIWAKAPAALQLPSEVPPLYNAQAYVCDATLYPTPAQSELRRRIAKPLTSWQCPYILMLGGVGTDGNCNNAIWRAAVNRLTFMPLR